MNAAFQCLPATYRRRRRTFGVILVATMTAMLYTTSLLFTEDLSSDIFTPQIPLDGVPLPPSTGSSKSLDDPDVNLMAGVTANTPMLYNTARRPAFFGAGNTKVLTTLPESLIPTSQNNRRLLFIGDVHGQIRPLESLLAKANFNPETDHLIFLGNLPGPRAGNIADSLALLDLAIQHNATLLRGPAEDRLVIAAPSYIAATPSGQTVIAHANRTADYLWAPSSDSDEEDGLEQGHFAHGDHADRALARAITPEHLAYVSATASILKIPMTNGVPSLAAVHGGLVPGIPLAEQDPNMVMTLKAFQYPVEQARQDDAVAVIDELVKELSKLPTPRTFGRRTYEKMVRAEFAKISKPEDRDLIVPVNYIDEDEASTPWQDMWNRRADGLSEAERFMVVAGHGAGKGLEEGKWTVGIDFGCVPQDKSSGKKKLAALVVDVSEMGMKREIVSVACGGWFS